MSSELSSLTGPRVREAGWERSAGCSRSTRSAKSSSRGDGSGARARSRGGPHPRGRSLQRSLAGMRGMGAGMRRARLGRERREWRRHPHLREETRSERGWAPRLGGARGTAGGHGTRHSGDTREPRGSLCASRCSRPHALTLIYRFPALIQLPTPPGGVESRLSLHHLQLKTVPSARVGRASLHSWSARTGAGRAVPFPEAATEDTRSGSRKQELPALLPDPPPLSLASPPQHQPFSSFLVP